MKETYSTEPDLNQRPRDFSITDSLHSPALTTELSVVCKLICNKQSLFSNDVICK